MIRVTVNPKGPLFDGTAPRILEEGVQAGVVHIAEFAKHNLVRSAGRFRYESSKPTHRWVGGLDIEEFPGRAMVLPASIPYNYWLEGTGSRNATSRFKGYRMWQRTNDYVKGLAVDLMREALIPFLARING